MHTSTAYKILAFFFVCSSLLFTFIIPPFQKTDEASHYYKTIAIASGSFVCTQDSEGAPYHTISKAYADLPQVLMSDITNESNTHRFPISTLKGALQTDSAAYSAMVKEPISCSLPSLLYVPVALVLSAPVALHASPLLVFYLGRLSFLFLGSVLIAFALTLVPKRYRLLLLGCFIVPTVGIQLGSFNKEVLHLGAGALVFATYFNLREKFSKKNIILLSLALYVVVLARPFYAPLFLLVPLSLPRRALKYLMVSLLIGASVFLAYLPKLLIFHNGTISSTGVSAALQLEFLRQHPTHFLSVVWSSYINHMPAYARSLIGTYGSIHYYLDWYVYAFFGAWLLLLGWYYRKKLPEFSRVEIIGISTAIVGIVMSAFFLFYLYATPVAYHWVVDVQGRYFIVILPFILLLIATAVKRYPQVSLGLLLSAAMFFFMKNAYNRYYDYSNGYVYENVEKLTALTQDPQLSFAEITQPITRVVSLDTSKELRGISLVVVNSNGYIAQPLMVEFLDAHCDKSFGSAMVMNHTRKATSAVDVRAPAISGTEVCLKIRSFSSLSTNAKPARVALDQPQEEVVNSESKIFAMPFYAY